MLLYYGQFDKLAVDNKDIKLFLLKYVCNFNTKSTDQRHFKVLYVTLRSSISCLKSIGFLHYKQIC